MICDANTQKYFYDIINHVNKLYEIANKARSKGLDPEPYVEIYKAEDLAARVEGLIGISGIGKRIRELKEKFSREEVAFKIIEDIINGKFGKFNDEVAADKALRAALAIMTEGITAAPLQGIESVRIKRNFDGSKYLAIYYAGPMRSAGGTEQALTVVFGDYIRILLHLDRYKITNEEIGRFIEEIRLYERKVGRFQYHPSDDELRRILSYLPVEVTGPPTDKYQVSVYRNLERIETNYVRGGALRVINDGIYGKAEKLKKIVEKIGLDWSWLNIKFKENEENQNKIQPDDKYLVDVVGGRPIFSHPSRFGGFRLRYGRARNTGLAAVGINPATMIILESFIAIGTQLRIERPGKSATITPVDTIEGPIVKLKNGDVIRVENVEIAKKVKDNVEEILFLGDMLVAIGEFLENNHRLMPPGYCEEIWAEELRRKVEGNIEKVAIELGISKERLKEFIDNPLLYKPNEEEALIISKKLEIPLHPRYTYFWENISIEEIKVLQEWLRNVKDYSKVPLKNEILKKILEKACIPHKYNKEEKTITFEDSKIIETLFSSKNILNDEKISDSIEYLSKCCGIKIKAKGRSFIGARMGRPEKAKERVMKPPVHVLFPVGLAGGSQRNIVKAMQLGEIEVEIVLKKCPNCNMITYENICRKCNIRTIQIYYCQNCNSYYEKDVCKKCGVKILPYNKRIITISDFFEKLSRFGVSKDSVIKGVKGLSNSKKIPEIIEKGILRCKHKVFIYKDGTIRYDITNAPLTHFKPSEIGVSIEKLKELGYTKDYKGNELKSEDQILELKVQDIIIPESCAKYLYRVANYVDELLKEVYGLEPYYRLNSYKDLVGHLVIGLAPHTSAGVIGRIIGFTKASVCYAHPFWHAAKRRNCDGDEDAIMLALQALIDFSRHYLPEKVGGLMDAPLVLTVIIDPSEVDDECHNIEVVERLPLEFYSLCEEYSSPSEALKFIEIVKKKLGKQDQYINLNFSIYNHDINTGPLVTEYDKIRNMEEKVRKQLNLAIKIRAVDAKDVAERLLKHHFIPDLVGNFRAFLTQKFRCTRCGAKYRRIPLKGRCIKCNNELVLSVHEGNISKYLNISYSLAKEFNLDNFIKQEIELIERSLNDLIKNKRRIISLEEFMSQ
ncbi:MAG: DNA polymerase II large subunit [Candidatus Verstraetearchaeota archaeon]|jgi:DNA polymerase II large subunit|nr:DNA polymerase II large subunit [Candidatus Verstraetearchaeota archaeon]